MEPSQERPAGYWSFCSSLCRAGWVFQGFFFSFKGCTCCLWKFPRQGVESELQLPATAIAVAMWDPSCICNLHHSSWQYWILNPFSEARDGTRILMDTSQVCYC